MSLNQWKELLSQWSKDALETTKYREYIPAEAMDEKNIRIGYPGASELQLSEAEGRLGIKLPSSYKEFPKITNGWPIAGPFVGRLLSAQEVDWFAAKNRDWIDGWRLGQQYFSKPEPQEDKAHFVYGVEQNPLLFNDKYLDSALQISEGDIGVYLLNPKVTFDTGEWEAWVFESETGAERYRSFRELMLAEYESFLRLKDV